MRRGEVYEARLDPTQGSEQAGIRPVIVVSRDAINTYSPVGLVVPCTTHRSGRRIYPSQVLIRAPDGGLSVDSVALCEQARVLAKSGLARRRGMLSSEALVEIDRGLLIAFDLPGQV